MGHHLCGGPGAELAIMGHHLCGGPEAELAKVSTPVGVEGLNWQSWVITSVGSRG